MPISGGSDHAAKAKKLEELMWRETEMNAYIFDVPTLRRLAAAVGVDPDYAVMFLDELGFENFGDNYVHVNYPGTTWFAPTRGGAPQMDERYRRVLLRMCGAPGASPAPAPGGKVTLMIKALAGSIGKYAYSESAFVEEAAALGVSAERARQYAARMGIAGGFVSYPGLTWFADNTTPDAPMKPEYVAVLAEMLGEAAPAAAAGHPPPASPPRHAREVAPPPPAAAAAPASRGRVRALAASTFAPTASAPGPSQRAPPRALATSTFAPAPRAAPRAFASTSTFVPAPGGSAAAIPRAAPRDPVSYANGKGVPPPGPRALATSTFAPAPRAVRQQRVQTRRRAPRALAASTFAPAMQTPTSGPPAFSENVQRVAAACARRRGGPRLQQVTGGSWSTRLYQGDDGLWHASVPNPRTMGGYWRKKFQTKAQAEEWIEHKQHHTHARDMEETDMDV